MPVPLPSITSSVIETDNGEDKNVITLAISSVDFNNNNNLLLNDKYCDKIMLLLNN
jgi:hypothetical protein